MNSSLIRYGFILILLSLISGLFVSAMPIPRLGLSAHTIGILSGILLIAVGAVWPQFQLSGKHASLLKWSWVYSSYANWFGCLVGGIVGVGKMTPIASAGFVGLPAAEGFVTVMLVSVALTSFIAVGLSLWGLRS